MTTWAKMTAAQREEHLEKMRAGKKKTAKAKRGETVLAKSDQLEKNGTTGRINVQYWPQFRAELLILEWKTLPLITIREMLPILQDAVTKGQQALRVAQNAESGDRCSVCKNPFVNGRFFGQEQWHDHLTQGIAVLRSCSPRCQAEIERMANEIKKQTMEREHQRFNTRG